MQVITVAMKVADKHRLKRMPRVLLLLARQHERKMKVGCCSGRITSYSTEGHREQTSGLLLTTLRP
jgi:hypothetical protein